MQRGRGEERRGERDVAGGIEPMARIGRERRRKRKERRPDSLLTGLGCPHSSLAITRGTTGRATDTSDTRATRLQPAVVLCAPDGQPGRVIGLWGRWTVERVGTEGEGIRTLARLHRGMAVGAQEDKAARRKRRNEKDVGAPERQGDRQQRGVAKEPVAAPILVALFLCVRLSICPLSVTGLQER